MSTLAEVYLEKEKVLIDQLYNKIENNIKEMKKIPYLDSEGNPKEEALEYFVFTPEAITFNKRQGTKRKDKITTKELRDALKNSLRIGADITKAKINKTYGKSTFAGTPLYLFLNIVFDEIKKRSIVGEEIEHQTFGNCMIESMELENDFMMLKTYDDTKKVSMNYITLNPADEAKIMNKIGG
ncbi:hypothetical protein APF79_02540 [bacterium BRH_c32]|nr:MAG: hypothetical protein APF79_02540 [bacterium BRH_c32]